MRTDRHYSISLQDSYGLGGKPLDLFDAAGFTCVRFLSRPLTDEVIFYHVSGPDEVPEWMSPAEIDD